MGKQIKLVYDISSLPKGLNPSNLTKMWEQHNVVFWDSDKGTKPRLFDVGEEELMPLIVDTAGKEVDMEFYSKNFEENEKWDKELYNCKNSPMYYYQNYKTSVWPHNPADMREFMKGLQLEKIDSKDQEEAEKLWKEQKERVQEWAKTITLEHIKEEGARVKLLKEAYEVTVGELEQKIKDHVKLFDKTDEPIEHKKRVQNLVLKIRNHSPIPPEFRVYRTAKGKWDTGMLYVTNYDELLKMADAIFSIQGRYPEQVDTAAE